MAGAVAQTSIYPLDLVKTRLQICEGGKAPKLGALAKNIWVQEGPRAFYKGLVPSLLGIIPYAGIDLAAYETLKDMSKTYILYDSEPGPLVQLGCGTVSAAFGASCVYPLQVIRTRMQAQHSNSAAAYKGMSDVFWRTLQNESYKGFYKGLFPNLLKVFEESSHQDMASYNALIDGFVKAGDIELFDPTPVRDSVSWDTLMAGYAQGSHCKEAIEIFNLMMDLKLRLDNCFGVCSFCLCTTRRCWSALQARSDEAMKVFHEMESFYGVRQEPKQYGRMTLGKEQSKSKAQVMGEFVPVYVALGMIFLSTTLGLHTAKQQLMYSPSVRLKKKLRETIPEVVYPYKVVDEANKFIEKLFFRKAARVQEFESGLKYTPDPIRKDIYAQSPRAETVKSIGMDPSTQP
ncbi:hypothetical protein GH714_025185 [Hevea brasiliensis]|uniref:Uncharacterized protein n=1 Tax=Hevea brasiliensis TaxID=3981 RepID=A0A6A6MCY0_HEVBR|nr:hypothetical protein GH714_025185 [Hevea brasiliensis]